MTLGFVSIINKIKMILGSIVVVLVVLTGFSNGLPKLVIQHHSRCLVLHKQRELHI